jgi:G6PDH family F420-dependent oxidoreductase
MVEYGYALSSEEHAPIDLVKNSRRAEEAGFQFALISDHYHPWISKQGHSPFVWSVIGGISQVTERLRLGTGVTCPTMRTHPAVIAHAAATAGAMLPGRFFFGVGSGEALNEHILGDHWPPADIRLEMLEEAIDIIRLLWTGEEQNYMGAYYTVENARIYTLPDPLPPIYVAASGEKAATLAGEIGDGLIGTSPDEEIVEKFRDAGGEGKPCYGQVTVCWSKSRAEAEETIYKIWPTSGIPGSLHSDLPTPAHFEDAAKLLSKEQVVKTVPCGPDKDVHLEQVHKMLEAGYNHIYFHQIGPDQEGFFRFFERELRPELEGLMIK